MPIRTQRADLAEDLTSELRPRIERHLARFDEVARFEAAAALSAHGEATAADALPATCPQQAAEEGATVAMRGEIAGGEAARDRAMPRRIVVERQRGRPAISTASHWDATLFGAGGVASALTMHTASQHASLLPSARNSWRRDHRAFSAAC